MKAIVHDFHTEIFPNDEDAKKICKPGTTDCCVWLVMGQRGWECVYHNKMSVMSLVRRFEAGDTRAKRDGCELIKNFDPSGLEGEVEIPTGETNEK
jgi:hypothetical protein